MPITRPTIGSYPNSPRLISLAVAFDTPGLDTGIPVYSPLVGDVLLDAFLDVPVAWVGANAYADIGTYSAGASPGLYGSIGSGYEQLLNPGAALGGNTLRSPYDDIDLSLPLSSRARALGAGPIVPAVFLTTDPLELVISDDYPPHGRPPVVWSAGEATLHVIVATPQTR